jgi:hypothetical protein
MMTIKLRARRNMLPLTNSRLRKQKTKHGEKSAGETRCEQYAILMTKCFNNHYCEVKLQYNHKQRQNLSK